MRRFLWCTAGLAVVGWLGLAGVWVAQPLVMDVHEGNAVVWVCLVDGNGACGEGSPLVDVRFPW